MKKLILSIVAIAAISFTSDAQIIARGVSPAPIEGNKTFTWADNWGQTPNFNIPGTFVQDTLALVEDGSAGTNPDGHPFSQEGCGPLTNATSVNGKIAVVYRGTCEFGKKAINAQNAGAVAVIIINRDPEAIPMGAGVDGPNVTIPVIMLTTTDGAAITAQMALGPVVMFIGNKQNLLSNDLTIKSSNLLRPKSGAVISQLAQNGTEFNFEVGARLYNFGFSDAANVTLNAKVTDPSNTVVYDNSVTIASLLAGDSVDVDPLSASTLPQFSIASYPAGMYQLTYTLTSDSTDADAADNVYSANFLVSDSLFTYASVDPATNLPNTPNGSRPANPGSSFGSCIFIQDANASRVGVEGAYFSYTSTAADNIDVTGEEIGINLYEWQDAFIDLNDATITFDNLVPVSTEQFYYPSDLQDSMMLATFQSPVLLTDDAKYLLCVSTVNPLLFMAGDPNSDYTYNQNFYLQPVALTEVGGTYSALGFGGDAINSVGAKIFNANELGIEETEQLFANVYPNPANDKVNIRLNVEGNAQVIVTDLTGKVVLKQTISVNGGAGSLSIADLANGSYIFNITANNGASTNMSVIKR